MRTHIANSVQVSLLLPECRKGLEDIGGYLPLLVDNRAVGSLALDDRHLVYVCETALDTDERGRGGLSQR